MMLPPTSICGVTSRTTPEKNGCTVTVGVLTVETQAQAEERADPARMDKGGEAAVAALEMANLIRSLGD